MALAPAALATLALLLAGDGGEAPLARVAVMPFLVEGLALDEASTIEGSVRRAAADATRSAVLSEARTVELLRAASTLGISCDRRKASCIAEYGGLFGVESVLTGVVRVSDDGPHLTITSVDVALKIEDRRVSGTLPFGKVQDAVDALVFQLFHDPAMRLGAIAIEADAGCELLVDDALVGRAPLDEPVTGLTIGQHVVVARCEGRVVKSASIRVGAGQLHAMSLVDDDTISRDVVRDAGRTLLYGGGTALGVGAAGLVAALVPFVSGWILFVALENPVRLAERRAEQLVPIYAAYSVLYDWQPLGMATVVAALGIAFVGVGLAIGGGSTLFLLGPEEEPLLAPPARPGAPFPSTDDASKEK